jgi:vitamin B12 transporter
MYLPSLARLAGRSFAFGAALAAAALRAQTAPVPPPDESVTLENYVVSATRTPQDLEYAPSDVTPVLVADLATMQVTDLRTALAQTPGVTVVNTGAVGGQSSVFLRGANSDLTLFIVDGVRLNTANISYANFFGGADLAGLDRIEVLLGPQSTLYGSSALGGVILLETTHGAGAPSGVVSTFVGSFGSFGAEATLAGGTDATSYSAAIDHEQTDNDRANNKYRDWNYSTRLEEALTPWLLAGATLRGQVGNYEEPGPLGFVPPGDVLATTDLATAYLEARSGDDFRSRLTTAWYQDEYTYDDGSPYDDYYARNTREIVDWQNTWEAAKWAELVAGINAEWSYYDAGGVETDRSLAEYLSTTLHPIEQIELTAGLRHDHFDTAGDATTGRAGLAYIPVKNTKLRATYGTGFNAPTPSDRYGQPPYILPNPGVQPETSRGWDAGIDQTILQGGLTLSATYFENRFRNLLDYEIENYTTYAGQYVNVDRATTSGVELAASAKLGSAATVRGEYTYLQAMDEVTDTRLIRRPRHTFDGGVEARITQPWLVGAGVHLVADRLDGAYAPVPLGGYTTVRFYTSYALRPNLALKLRVENALNRSYQETAGYPALPRGIDFAVEWHY